MTTLMSDDGTGQSNGTALDTAKWTTEGTTQGGGDATYQSSALRFRSGNQGGYAGTSRTTRSFNISNVADIEVTGTFTNDGNEPYPQVVVRATTSTVDYSNGYAMGLDPVGTTWTVQKIVSFSGTTLGTKTFTISGNTTYGFRFRVVGTSLKARIWTGTEPGTWDIDITDSTFTSAGKAGITVGAGNAAVQHTCTFDNIVVTNGTTDVSLTETATLADAMSVTAAVPLAETATLTDGTLAVANLLATQTETMTLVDGTLSVAASVPLAETATLTDAMTVGVNALLTETATLTDGTLAVTVDAPMSETGTLVDAMSVEVFQLRHDLKTEIEFTSGVWTDVSEWVAADVESVGSFGRPTRFEDVAASTWDTTLRNSDGRFTPGNPNSPYYPNVAKGKNVRVSVTYSGQTYPRFYGQIAGISMPAITSAEDATVRVQCADVMATLARKTLLSPFVEESRRQARINSGGGVDVFPFPSSSVKADGSIQVADTSFENKGYLFPSSTRMGSITVMAVANGAGSVKSSGADSDGGVLSEGQLDFETADNGFGKQAHPILVCKPQVGFNQFELFFKIPENVLPAIQATGTYTVQAGNNWNTVGAAYGMTQAQLAELNPTAYPTALGVGQVLNISNSTDNWEWVLADFWAGSTEILRIVLGDTNGKLIIAAKKPSGGAGYLTSTTTTLADGKWRKLTIYKTGTNSVQCNINDSPAGAPVTSMAGDLASVDTVYLTGRHNPSSSSGAQVQCPPCSVGGVAFQKTRNGVWYYYTLGAPPANISARDRFTELIQYADPIAPQSAVFWHSSLNLPFDSKVVRTNITGRSVLDCLQELARTMGAYLWVEPDTGKLTMRKGPTPPTSLANVDLVADADVDSPPQWRDTVDVNPTRVTAKCPAGEITSINSTAEAGGQYKDLTIDTCAPTIAVAKAVADRFVTSAYPMRLSSLTVDLVHAGNPMWGLMLPVFLPTERVLHVTSVPEAVLGFDTSDATIESWTESYTIDSAKFTFETTPIANYTSTPPLAGFTVTSSTGVQTDGAVVAAQPSGLASGDLLMAVMTVDNTGTLAGMAPPDATWTARGSGGSGNSGYGNVWTKTAGAAEPTSYTFTVTGSSGSAVLMSDDWTGSNGAAWNSSKWDPGEVRTGATKTVQSNAGRQDPGTLTGYSGRISTLAKIADKADVDIVISFKVANGDCFPFVLLRGDSGGLGSFGYQFRPGLSGMARLAVITPSYTETVLGSIAGSITPGTWYRLRFRAVGSAIKARIWPTSSAEPSSWGIEVTNTAITAAGKVVIGAAGGNAVGSTVDWDDCIVSDPNAVAGWPEAKLDLLRVSGADTADPMLVTPSWTTDNAATTSHDAPTISPASSGLMVNHWHLLTGGSSSGGSGGGGGGSSSAFNFGFSGFTTTGDATAEINAVNVWLTNHSLKAVGHWADSDATVQQAQWGIAPGTRFGSWTGIIDIAVGGVFGSETWAQAASGTFDTRWQTALDNIAAAWGARPPGNLHIRFAHEFNGSFSEWAVGNSGNDSYTNFKTAWIRFANKVRATLPGAQIVWSPNDGTSSLTHVDDAYPGSSYVDVIGVDSYNAYPHVNTLAAWTSKINGVDGNGNPLGIESWRQYALTKGKPLAIPEWGNPAVDTGGGAGGGDAPDYVARFIAWCKANGGFGAGQVKYACYFNIGTVGGYAADYLIYANGSNGTVHQPLTAQAVRDNA